MSRPTADDLLAPAAAFVVGLVLVAAITGGDGDGTVAPRTAPAAVAEPPDRERVARPLVLAAVAELPTPLATPTPTPAPPPPRPAPRRVSAPAATPTATPTPEPRATPPPTPAPAPAPPPPAPPAPTPAPTFDETGSGPAFDDEGVSP